MSTERKYLQLNMTRAGEDLVVLVRNGTDEDKEYVEGWLRDCRQNTLSAPAVFTVHPTDGHRMEMRQRVAGQEDTHVERASEYEGLVPDDYATGSGQVGFGDDQTGGHIVRRVPTFGEIEK